jgi:hypothetical protein
MPIGKRLCCWCCSCCLYTLSLSVISFSSALCLQMKASHSHRYVPHFSRHCHCSFRPSLQLPIRYYYYGSYINIFYNRLNSEILCVRVPSLHRMCSADGSLEEILLLACKYLLSCVGGKKKNDGSMDSGAGVMGGGMGMDSESKGSMSGGMGVGAAGMKSGGMGSTMKSGGFGSMGGAGMKGGAMGSMGGGAGGMKGG